MTSFAIIPFCSHSILLKNFSAGGLVERCHFSRLCRRISLRCVVLVHPDDFSSSNQTDHTFLTIHMPAVAFDD